MMITTTQGAVDLALRPPQDRTEWQAIHTLRRRSLFAGEQIYRENHPDDRAGDQRVLTLVSGGEFIGTMRADLSHPVWAAFRLVAIAPYRRGHGYGSAMIRMAEDFVRERGWRRVRLHAVEEAVGFYKRCGFHPVSWDEPSRIEKCVDMGKSL